MDGMTEGKAILSIVVGCAAIAGSFLIKQFYTGNSAGGSSSAQGRPVPRWYGRLMFFFGGLVFVLMGLKFFLLDQ